MTASEQASSPRAALRARLAAGELITAPGVFDGISASLLARLGFAAGYMTGAGVAASGFGLPDIGLVTQTEMAERARMLVRCLDGVPLIADADTGYGAAVNVVRTVREYEAAGVAAIQLEDQAFPKKCGHLPDKELIGADEFVAKLTAALDARTDPVRSGRAGRVVADRGTLPGAGRRRRDGRPLRSSAARAALAPRAVPILGGRGGVASRRS